MSRVTDLTTEMIARRLAAARRDLGWTLAQASAVAALSVAHLSRIEKGTRQPSIGVLIELARVYQLSLGQLVGEEPHAVSHVMRHDQVQTHEGPDGGYAVLSGIIGDQLLGAIRLDLPTNGSTSKRSRHAGEEWLYVLTGSVRFVQGDTVADLEPHDAVHLDAQVPHHLSNVTARPASVLLVTAGSGPTRANGHTPPVAMPAGETTVTPVTTGTGVDAA